MLEKWTEILPLFVVRWLALRYCERFHFKTSPELLVTMPRPDVLVKLPPVTASNSEDPGAAPLTYERIRELVDEAGIDWHNGWPHMGGDATNRYVVLVRAVEHAHGIGVKLEGGEA